MATYRMVVTISNSALGGTGTNTWHARSLGEVGGIDPDLSGLMDIVKNWYDDMKFYTDAGTKFRWDGLASGVGAAEGQYSNSTPWEITGGGTGGVLAPALAVCVNWRGATGDRSRRGRTFFGPCGIILNTGDGTLPTTQLGEMRTAAADLVSASLADGNGALGVWSRQESVFRDFVASSIKDQFAVLRSRRD